MWTHRLSLPPDLPLLHRGTTSPSPPSGPVGNQPSPLLCFTPQTQVISVLTNEPPAVFSAPPFSPNLPRLKAAFQEALQGGPPTPRTTAFWPTGRNLGSWPQACPTTPPTPLPRPALPSAPPR